MANTIWNGLVDELVGQAIACGFAAGLASAKENHVCEDASGLRKLEASHLANVEDIRKLLKEQLNRKAEVAGGEQVGS